MSLQQAGALQCGGHMLSVSFCWPVGPPLHRETEGRLTASHRGTSALMQRLAGAQMLLSSEGLQQCAPYCLLPAKSSTYKGVALSL